MALVHRVYGCVVGNLLTVVGGVDVEFIVVNADFIIWVAGKDGDLYARGEDVGSRDVEAENCGVLEDETWFLGLYDGPEYEDDY